MTEHEHEWRNIDGTDYSRCICGYLRHNKDDHIFSTAQEALRPKGGSIFSRFLIWFANPMTTRDFILCYALQIGVALSIGLLMTLLLVWLLGGF